MMMSMWFYINLGLLLNEQVKKKKSITSFVASPAHTVWYLRASVHMVVVEAGLPSKQMQEMCI